jgi:hypothetical protein
MSRILIFAVLSIVLTGCMGGASPREGWRHHYDEPPVYDYYYGDAGNPVDQDPVFFENSVLSAD